MELHTVSPASGYTQADVTNFAKRDHRLVDLGRRARKYRRATVFRPTLHEAGGPDRNGPGVPGWRAGWRWPRWLSWPPTLPRTSPSGDQAGGSISWRTSRHRPRSGVIEGVSAGHAGRPGPGGGWRWLGCRLPGRSRWPSCATPQDYVLAAMRGVGSARRQPAQHGVAIMRGAGAGALFARAVPDWLAGPGRRIGPGRNSLMRRVDWAYGFSQPRRRDGPGRRSPMRALGPLLSRRDRQRADPGGRIAPRCFHPVADVTRIPEALTCTHPS